MNKKHSVMLSETKQRKVVANSIDVEILRKAQNDGRKTPTKSAFTMVEFLVALVVLGALLAVMLPVLRIFVENKNARMLEKAYYNVESIVAALKSDNVNYPDCSTSNADPACGSAVVGGFQNTLVKQANGSYLATDAKFANLFAAKLNALGYNPTACTATSCTATTPDGMTWDLKDIAKRNNNWSTAPVIAVDINGAQGPNCMEGDAGCTTPDKMCVAITQNGQLRRSACAIVYANGTPCDNGNGTVYGGYCVTRHAYGGINTCGANAQYDSLCQIGCMSCNVNMFAGAKKACETNGKRSPTRAEGLSLGLPASYFNAPGGCIWTGEDNPSNVTSGYTIGGGGGMLKSGAGCSMICLSEP